jgi:hypothetical protein
MGAAPFESLPSIVLFMVISASQPSKEVVAMRKGWLGTAFLGVLYLTLSAPLAGAGEPASTSSARDSVKDAKALAARIDKYIDAKRVDHKVEPAPQSGDAEFFRRLSLDLIGRIPSLIESRDFIDDDREDKRWIWINDLLEMKDGDGERAIVPYANHFANVWRHILLPQSNNFQARFFANNMEAWLRGKLKENAGYDKIVRELLTAQVFGGNNGPSVFYQANEFKVENLAANTSRLFLGHKLECAQCHDHPFAKWSKNQFWEYAAFFSGINPQRGEVPNSREIKITGTEKVVKARFLDGTDPKWENGKSSRATLAEWITRADNPYFAKATVNKVWAYFFGFGLIDPLDEPSEDNPPSHPELLDELAKEFAAHNFDLKFLIRAIVGSKTYQLTSVQTDPSQKDLRLYGRMAVRGLSPEQLFDSVAQVIEYKSSTEIEPQNNPFGPRTTRGQFLAKFADEGKPSEMETSILQALFMMNGEFTRKATRPSKEDNNLLYQLATSTKSVRLRVEQMYLAVLNRLPTAKESARFVKYIEKGGKNGSTTKAFEDAMWALLNSGEFMLNH